MDNFEDLTTCGEQQIFLEECEECDDCTSRGLAEIVSSIKEVKHSIIENYNYLKARIGQVEGTVQHFQNTFAEIWAYISRLTPPVPSGGSVYNWSSVDNNTGEVLMKTSSYDYEFSFEKLPCPIPVQGVFISMSDINPSNYWQGTTWHRIAKGRTIFGQGEHAGMFDEAGQEGGDYNATLPSHSHNVNGNTDEDGTHRHTITYHTSADCENGSDNITLNSSGDAHTWTTNNGEGSHKHHLSINTNSVGSSSTNKNVPPYVVVYMWERDS